MITRVGVTGRGLAWLGVRREGRSDGSRTRAAVSFDVTAVEQNESTAGGCVVGSYTS
jgi:hypothetical protein